MLHKGLMLLAIALTVPLAAPAQVTSGRAGVKSENLGYGPADGSGDHNGGWMVTGPSQERLEQLRHGSEVHTITPSPSGGMQTSAVSATSLAAPKKARAAFDKAMREFGKGPSANLGKARQYLEKAVAEYPEYADAWTALGQVKAQSGDNDGAIVALEKAVQADERYVPPYDALVRLYMGKGDWDHATELTKFVLDINPADAKMRWYQAVCSYEAGHDDQAMALIDEIQNDAEAAEQFPQTHRFLGLIYAKRGQFGEAAAAYKRYLELAPEAEAAAAVKQQLNEWQQLGVL